MKKINKELTIIVAVMIAALGLFIYLYQDNEIPVERPAETGPTGVLDDWTVDDSAANGLPLEENKDIYVQDNNIYDVYISIFPTKDENGQVLDFSSFELHEARNHDYNPTLNCNVQIVGEDEKVDPLVNLDSANATIRVRGNSSRGDLYKSYKVKLLDDDDAFFGQTNLNINKHSEDVTKIATKLECDLLTDIDNMASYRTYFMRVWIRDASLPESEQKFEYYGLYTELEQPNKSYLEARNLPENAVMYKARNFSFDKVDALRDVDDPLYNEREFETILGIREAVNHEKLLEMVDAVNDETNDFEEIFHKYFNEDNYLTWLAFNLLTGNNDAINHNFIIYSPENANTWYFLPWDFDGTLHFGDQVSSLMALPESLQGGQKLNQSVLHRRYFRLSGSREKIAAKMEELLQNDLTEEKILGLVEGYLPVLEKTVAIHPDILLMDMAPSELPGYLRDLHAGMVSNYEAFKRASEYPVPMYVALPEQNDDGTVHFAWQPSYSYQGRTITYTVRVYTDYNMKNLVLEQKDLVEPYFDTETALDPGVYYLKVTAVDSEGNEQLSMERFETMLTEIKAFYVNGLLEFTVE